jgi:hypothetical protein
MSQKPPVQKGRNRGGAEDYPERRASDKRWHPGELRMKLLDVRPHDRNVASKLVIGISEGEIAVLWHPAINTGRWLING